MRPSLPELNNLSWGQALCPSALDAPFFSFLYALPLPLCTELGLELRNRAQHMEHQPARGITRRNLLIEDVEMHLFPVQFRGDLAEMQGGTGQAV